MSETNVLQKIASSTRQRVDRLKKETPLGNLKARVASAEKPLDFALALQGSGIKLIAEIKRASPSKGPLNPDLDARELAGSYARGGAAAISVVTEPTFFKGNIQDMTKAKTAAGLPVLRKDFLLEEYQVYESRAYGADAVLLIAALHEVPALRSLMVLARDLGMSILTEVHNKQEVEKALAAGATLIGINNRNLEDFSVDLNTTLRLKALIPPEIPVVSESGILTPRDLALLQSAGVKAVLIGEALVTSPDPERKVRELLGTPAVIARHE
ncbi:MAG: indole-3-glycerol phosphate synthase TrpC [Dehalococcoidia bacterium]|nr:indole-3-glycerol phosphate synthase TrpC [Dehalococcoidia bacterium]